MTDTNMDKKLDTALAIWGRDERVDAAAIARLMLHADQIPQPSVRRWMPWAAGGAAVAASVAVALLFAGPLHAPKPSPVAAEAEAAPESAFAGQASFSLLYTPTADEEQFI